MRSTSSRSLIFPCLILALGILGGVALAEFTQDYGLWVLSGPLLLALSIIVAYGVHRGIRQPSAESLVWAGGIFLGGAIGAVFDPSEVGTILMLTGPLAWVLLMGDRRQRC